MQIYGILLNIRGIFTENAWKTVEKQWKIVEFPRNSFLNTYLDDPFSRSFPVVSRSFFRSFLEKISENQRISEKIREYRGKSFLFIPFLSTSLHFHSSFSNQPDFMLYNMFIVDTLSERLNV